MRISTHRAITRAVAYALSIRGGPMLEAMLRGVEGPDRDPEREVEVRVGRRGGIYLTTRRVRHHTTENRHRIMGILWRSRRMLLEGRPIEAAYLLGRALHYAQDMFVPPWDHAGTEAASKLAPIPAWEVEEAAREALCSPSYIEYVLAHARPVDGPAALSEAAKASARIAAAVLGPADPPEELLEAERAERRSHLAKMLAAAASAALIIPSLILLPPAAPLLLAAAAASYAMDGRYRSIKKELKWFRKPRR